MIRWERDFEAVKSRRQENVVEDVNSLMRKNVATLHEIDGVFIELEDDVGGFGTREESGEVSTKEAYGS